MSKHIVRNLIQAGRHARMEGDAHAPTGFVALRLSHSRLADWDWQRILVDAGLLAAFALTSSLLIRP